MTREESKYCEECKHCQLIERTCHYYVYCSKRVHCFDDAVVYCRHKKLKKEKKENVK